MNKEQLQSLLHEEYKTENWKKISEFVFPNVQYLQKPQDIPVTDKIVKSFRQLGNVKLNDGKNLAMFEVKVAENVNIAHNRVALRGLVKDYIDQERNHGVLVIYEQGKDDYRFTFTAKSTEFDNEKLDFVNRETDSKRFTYVLGKNESCKTPAERFYSLAQNKDNADIKAVEDAFSVEKLSKQFFKEYKEHYLKFVDYLIADNSYRTAIFKENEKDIRNFVKLLLGRLVFIQFVQKKKWMGVPADNTGWDSGDPKFLYNSFKDFKNKELFYSQFLEPLFYDALSKNERKNDIFTVTGTKIPFLNGGLFEKSNIDTSMLCFPAEYFSELFEFFDKYNFTINEYDPIEHEIGIDPEMLGSIFENLLEDNKDKGAFYTPKEIVHYMCQESLKEYLKTNLQEKKLWKDNDELEPALEAFVKQKEASGIIDYDEQLAIALRDVKICDPAIGSGAFPMGLLNEIYQCVYVLHSASPDVVGDVWNMGDDWQPDVVKKNIIQNSIYGVDIEKGAVDIARLRFWLSLIIDEPEPHALPNLDYKIVVGNSLLSKYGDEVIDIDWSLDYISQGLFAAEIAREKESLLKNLSKKQIEFFNQNSDKTKLSIQIRNLKIDLIINQLQLMIDKQNIQKQPRAEEYGNKAKFVKANELYLQTENWRRIIKQLQNLKTQNEKPLDFFDWKLDFPEIMNEYVAKKVGFDIVIGNPPYGVSIKGDTRKQMVTKIGKVPDYEIYYYFIEISKILLKNSGVKSFIIPNTFLFNVYASEYRSNLIKCWNIKCIVDCTDFKLFEGATVYNAITVFKPLLKDSKVDTVGYKNTKNAKSFNDLQLRKNSYVESSKLLENNKNWALSFKLEENVLELLSKIRKNSKCLFEVFPDYSQGLIAYDKYRGQDPEIISTRAYHYSVKSKPTLKNWLWGEDVTKYNLKWNEQEWIDYPSGIANPRQPKFFKGKRLLVREITNPSIYCAITDKEFYHDPAIIVVLDSNNCLENICAILNSKLATFYHFNSSPKATKGAFPKILVEDIKHFPIKIPKDNNYIKRVIEQIHKDKENGKNTDKLENQVEIYVYTLYKLTYNEIKIIDPEFSLSKEEYDNIKID